MAMYNSNTTILMSNPSLLFLHSLLTFFQLLFIDFSLLFNSAVPANRNMTVSAYNTGSLAVERATSVRLKKGRFYSILGAEGAGLLSNGKAGKPPRMEIGLSDRNILLNRLLHTVGYFPGKQPAFSHKIHHFSPIFCS